MQNQESKETKIKALEHLSNVYELEMIKDKTFEEQFKVLVSWVEYLIDKDFSKLVNILYKIDVSESKMKIALAKSKGKNAGKIIAKLILEREIEKRKFREMFSQKMAQKKG